MIIYLLICLFTYISERNSGRKAEARKNADLVVRFKLKEYKEQFFKMPGNESKQGHFICFSFFDMASTHHFIFVDDEETVIEALRKYGLEEFALERYWYRSSINHTFCETVSFVRLNYSFAHYLDEDVFCYADHRKFRKARDRREGR